MIIINPKVPFKTYIFNNVDSTNNICKQLAFKGEESALVIASCQTAGRGRLGRDFFSPNNTGLYMSLLLRPRFSANESISITTAAAVAVSNAIEKNSGEKCFIKWVNDIYIRNKKVCGILCESAFSKQKQGLDYVVLGIGINLFPPQNGFPGDIKDKAGSVFDSINCDKKLKEKLIEDIIDSFLKIYNNLPNKDYMNEYRKKSMLTGKTVSFLKDNKTVTGSVIDINDKAEIVIETTAGIINLFAGEVSLEF